MTKDEALAPTSIQCEVQDELCSSQEPCGGCGGSGWVPRDPDIGTEQECFDCNGSGALNRGESKLRWEAIAAIEEALAQPEQEPEPQPASEEDMTVYRAIAANYNKDLSTPEQRNPLTLEQKQAVKFYITVTKYGAGIGDFDYLLELVIKETEAAYDIKKENT